MVVTIEINYVNCCIRVPLGNITYIAYKNICVNIFFKISIFPSFLLHISYIFGIKIFFKTKKYVSCNRGLSLYILTFITLNRTIFNNLLV